MPTRRWHLTYPEALVQDPIVYRLIRDHDLLVNIRRADVDAAVGWILLEVSGDTPYLDAAKAWLEEVGIIVSDAGGDVLAG